MMSQVREILAQIETGDPSASDKLLPLVYAELRTLAAAWLRREDKAITLDATGLVHEAYVRLVGSSNGEHWDCPGHFFAAAATAMRRVLIDRARRKQRHVHGGSHKRVAVDPDLLASNALPSQSEKLLELDAVLTKLAEKDPLKSRLVELRFFAGLSGAEAAKVLGISPRTVDRHWAFARAWIRRELEKESQV